MRLSIFPFVWRIIQGDEATDGKMKNAIKFIIKLCQRNILGFYNKIK